MKHRNPLILLLLSLVTLGVYNIYWFETVKSELNVRNSDSYIPSSMIFVIPLILGIATFIWGMNTGDPDEIAIVTLLGLFLLFMGAGSYFYWVWRFAKSLAKASSNKLSVAVTMLIFIFADEIAPTAMQFLINATDWPEQDKLTS